MLTDIPNHPGYRITRDGRVWSDISQKWLSLWTLDGYYRVQLGRSKHFAIRRLVLETFVGTTQVRTRKIRFGMEQPQIYLVREKSILNQN